MRIPLETIKSMDGFARAFNDIKQLLLGRLTFGDNIQATIKTVTFSGTPDTDLTFAHGLERIPTGWIAAPDRATNIYKGSVAWTAKQITLKSSVASAVVTLTIF